MKSQCISAVENALGRKATASELQEIENRLTSHMRQMARSDRQAVLSMSPAERVSMAADRAAKELIAEKARVAENRAMNVIAKAKLREIADANKGNAVKKLTELLAQDYGDVDSRSVESAARVIYHGAVGEMLDAIMAAQPKLLGLLESTQGVDDLFREMHGNDTGNVLAKEGAQQFKSVSESLRQRKNAAGGDVGKLEDWTMPNHHSHTKIVQAGKSKWVDDIKDLVNREKYVKENGDYMNDKEVVDFLGFAYDSIATGGANKIIEAVKAGEPIPTGVGSMANRGSASRQIHFKDADAQLEYWKNYGEKGLLDVMLSHIKGVSSEIAMLEAFGPNAVNNFRTELDYAAALDKTARPADIGKIDGDAATARLYLDQLAGDSPGVANQAFANVMRGVRSINVLKLGKAYITSLSDHGFSWLTAGYNKLDYTDVLKTQAKLTFSKEYRVWARRNALGIDSVLSGLSRMSGDGFESFSGPAESFARHSQKVASAFMKATFLQQATDIRRQAFAITYMDALGRLTRKPMDSYGAEDIAHLERLGVKADDWKVWNLAKTEDPTGRGDTVLTAKAIQDISDSQLIKAMPELFGKVDLRKKDAISNDVRAKLDRIRNDAAVKLMSVVTDEARIAILEPTMSDRAAMTRGHQPGTVAGELMLSFWQFKSFGASALLKHVQRAKSIPNGAGKAAYVAKLVSATTLGGAMAYQLSGILSGQDPQDMNPETKNGRKFWMAALLKGGGMGIFGDFLFGETSKSGGSLGSVALGPTGGLLIDPLTIAGKESAYQLAQASGETMREPDTEAAWLRYGKQFVPGATAWYLQGAFDHLIWHDLQEAASPGYLRRMEGRIKKETGKGMWWTPGEALPEKAPDLAAAVGE